MAGRSAGTVAPLQCSASLHAVWCACSNWCCRSCFGACHPWHPVPARSCRPRPCDSVQCAQAGRIICGLQVLASPCLLTRILHSAYQHCCRHCLFTEGPCEYKLSNRNHHKRMASELNSSNLAGRWRSWQGCATSCCAQAASAIQGPARRTWGCPTRM